MPVDESSTRPPRNGAGSIALTFGFVALVGAFVPFVGEFIAVPTAVAAMILGWVGFERAESGEATNSSQAITGGLLGLMAGLVVLFIYLAGLTPR